MSELEPFLAILRRAAVDQTVDGNTIHGATQALMEASERCSPAERDALLDALRELLDQHGPVTGAVAMLAGAILEEGGDVSRVEGWFVETLPGLLRACSDAKARLLELGGGTVEPDRLDELLGALAESDPRLFGSWQTFTHFWPPFIVVLGCSPLARTALRDQRDVALALRDDLEGAHWIGQMLGVVDDEPFVAIDPVARRGYAGTFGGVADNFQLHTLLADALIGDPKDGWLEGTRPAPEVARCARGEGPQNVEPAAHGAWNLYTWRAFAHDPTLTDSASIPHDLWVWGEGIPTDIPTLDGHRVIGLGPSAYQRSWQGGRVFATLRAALTVTGQLDEAELERWFARIASEGPQA